MLIGSSVWPCIYMVPCSSVDSSEHFETLNISSGHKMRHWWQRLQLYVALQPFCVFEHYTFMCDMAAPLKDHIINQNTLVLHSDIAA